MAVLDRSRIANQSRTLGLPYVTNWVSSFLTKLLLVKPDYILIANPRKCLRCSHWSSWCQSSMMQPVTLATKKPSVATTPLFKYCTHQCCLIIFFYLHDWCLKNLCKAELVQNWAKRNNLVWFGIASFNCNWFAWKMVLFKNVTG